MIIICTNCQSTYEIDDDTGKVVYILCSACKDKAADCYGDGYIEEQEED